MKIRKRMKETDAYFTVEAAMVMPFVLGAVLLTIYLLIFQYDRCLMEQSVGIMALRGCSLQIDDKRELISELIRQSESDDRGYVAWSMEEMRVYIRGSKVVVQREGKLKFPFTGFALRNIDDIWHTQAKYNNHRIAPVSFIRDYRKLLGGK